MNILDIYKELKRSYKNYIGSFVSIKDERIRKEVSEAIQSEKLWPDALIQFNPNFASGIDVSQMIKNGFPIHKDLGFKSGKTKRATLQKRRVSKSTKTTRTRKTVSPVLSCMTKAHRFLFV